jgi:hypothetical protein
MCISYGSETKSVKGPGNTFDLSPKWARTLLFVGNEKLPTNGNVLAHLGFK